jgi:peptidoglycan/LPS O-acetylase OafA/YrhL
MTSAPVARADLDANADGGSAIARYPGLDGIRGIAILLVLALHFGFFPRFYTAATDSLFIRWMARSLVGGWIGVDLFFVLSGFLITSILLASKDRPRYFRNFYGRRAVRIFPLYYTALAVGLFVAPALFGERWLRFMGDSWSKQAWLWTYALNIGFTIGVVRDAGMFGPLWSLAVEEQYYLVWPWIVKFTSRAVLGGVCATFIVGSLMLRVALLTHGFQWTGAYYFTLARLDPLAVGAGIALLMQDAAWSRRLERWALPGLALGATALAMIFIRYPLFSPTVPFIVTYGHSVLAFMFGWLVVIALRNPAPNWLCARWLTMLGKYSYGIYVWHWFVRQILGAVFDKFPASSPVGGAGEAIAFLVVGVMISTLCGVASYFVIEEPVLRLKRRFRYAPAPDARAAGLESDVVGRAAGAWDVRHESAAPLDRPV